MESIQILDEKRIAEISRDATKYARDIIDTNPLVNFETIVDLKRQLLTKDESFNQMRDDLKKQIERSEKRHAESVKQMQEHIESLTKQLVNYIKK